MRRNATTIVVAIAVLLLVLPGIAAVAVGGTSAQAGWWLVAVGAILIGLALATRVRRPA